MATFDVKYSNLDEAGLGAELKKRAEVVAKPGEDPAAQKRVQDIANKSLAAREAIINAVIAAFPKGSHFTVSIRGDTRQDGSLSQVTVEVQTH